MPRIFSHHYDMHQCDACQGSDCVQPHRASLAGAERQLPISHDALSHPPHQSRRGLRCAFARL